jgi:ribonuclease P protein component
LKGYSWQKEMRLRRPQDFRRVWKEGRSWAHPLFIIWAAPNNLSGTRFGLTASRKVGNAVERNRARRLLREAARHLAAHIPPGWDVVLVARRAILKAKAQRVQGALKVMLQRADLWSAD